MYQQHSRQADLLLFIAGTGCVFFLDLWRWFNLFFAVVVGKSLRLFSPKRVYRCTAAPASY